jgi:hypothetical protein
MVLVLWLVFNRLETVGSCKVENPPPTSLFSRHGADGA